MSFSSTSSSSSSTSSSSTASTSIGKIQIGSSSHKQKDVEDDNSKESIRDRLKKATSFEESTLDLFAL